jgi:anti-anti-sigma factor
MWLVSLRGTVSQSNRGVIFMESFFVRAHDAGEYALVTVGGELDIATGPLLRECLSDLVDRGHTTLVLDFEALEFMDASGISVLVAARTSAQRRDGRLCLIHVHPRVHRVLHLLQLTEAVPAFDSIQDALDAGRHCDQSS